MVQIATRPEAARQPGGAPVIFATGRLVRCQVGGSPFVLPLERVAEVVALGTGTAAAPRGWIGTLVRNERYELGSMLTVDVVGPQLTADGSAVAIETLELAHDGLKLG